MYNAIFFIWPIILPLVEAWLKYLIPMDTISLKLRPKNGKNKLFRNLRTSSLGSNMGLRGRGVVTHK